MSKPAHKQDKFPGQIKYEKKLTFEEWWEKNKKEYPIWFQVNTIPAKDIWKAAQENKKTP